MALQQNLPIQLRDLEAKTPLVWFLGRLIPIGDHQCENGKGSVVINKKTKYSYADHNCNRDWEDKALWHFGGHLKGGQTSSSVRTNPFMARCVGEQQLMEDGFDVDHDLIVIGPRMKCCTTVNDLLDTEKRTLELHSRDVRSTSFPAKAAEGQNNTSSTRFRNNTLLAQQVLDIFLKRRDIDVPGRGCIRNILRYLVANHGARYRDAICAADRKEGQTRKYGMRKPPCSDSSSRGAHTV